MLGQPASSQTVCSPSRLTRPLSSLYSGPMTARVLIHSGLRSIGVWLLRTSRRSSLRPSGETVMSDKDRLQTKSRQGYGAGLGAQDIGNVTLDQRRDLVDGDVAAGLEAEGGDPGVEQPAGHDAVEAVELTVGVECETVHRHAAGHAYPDSRDLALWPAVIARHPHPATTLDPHGGDPEVGT